MFNFKLSFSSFRLCRRKSRSPVTTYFFSPFNPKVLEIAYPTIPSPPPTTPNHRPNISKSKTAPLTTTPELQNSPVSFDIKNPKLINKKDNINMTSSDESGWFSNSDGETESRSGNVDSLKKVLNQGTSKLCIMNPSMLNVGSTPMLNVKNDGGKTKKMNGEEKRKVMLMKDSLTVVKWSEQPYDDFKMSMLEMIVEKQMFEAKDMEQLLQCFLSLNSRHHHADIVAAFTEIWDLLFH